MILPIAGLAFPSGAAAQGRDAPTAPPPREAWIRADAPAPGPSEEPAAGARVLVVDDDARNVRLLTSLLSGRGFTVVAAPSGEEALRLLAPAAARDGGAAPDILLLDAMMPGLSGFEVCGRLRSDPLTRMIPIVMVTALNSVDEKVRALEAGADDFLTKPVNRVELLARVRSLLRVKRLRDEIEAARRDLAVKNAALRTLQAHRTTLSQMIVHDLRGPLTGIMGHAELLRSHAGGLGDAVSRPIEQILAASRHMRSMLADLLDVSLLEENRLPLRLERTDLHAAAAATIAEHRALADRARVALEVAARAGADRPGPASADTGIVLRVLSNLVGNALKHTPAGGRVFIEIEPAAPGSIAVRVGDTGEGIPEEDRERIFEKGARREGQRFGTRHDRGLGLTFCRMAVEAHGGRIWVESNAAGGSTFAFVLPAAGPRPAEAAP
jgi:signal transduction histidine kinase